MRDEIECNTPLTYIHDKPQQLVTVVCEHGTARVVEPERLSSRFFLLDGPSWFRHISLMEALGQP